MSTQPNSNLIPPVSDQSNNSSIQSDLLTRIAQASKHSHWLSRECRLLPSSWYGRLYFWCVAKRALWTRRLMAIDLEESRRILERIGAKEIDKTDHQMWLQYNRAIAKFNEIAPNHSLPILPPPKFEELVSKSIPDPVFRLEGDLFEQPQKCDQGLILKMAMEPTVSHLHLDVIEEAIRKFEQAGGRVVILPSLSSREASMAPCLGIKASDELIPVCHMGLVRSQTARAVLIGVKGILGLKQGNEKVRLAHGMKGGYYKATLEEVRSAANCDNLEKKGFEEAFGIPRPPRFGQTLGHEMIQGLSFRSSWRSKLPWAHPPMKSHFIEKYWSHDPESPDRKVFIAFADTGLGIIQELLMHNPPKSSDASLPLRGVNIVCIPDQDWISNYRMSAPLTEKIYNECLAKLSPMLGKKGLIDPSKKNSADSETLPARRPGMVRSPAISHFGSLESLVQEDDEADLPPYLAAHNAASEEGAWLLAKEASELTRDSIAELYRFVDEVLAQRPNPDELYTAIESLAKAHIYRLAFRRYARLFQPLAS